MLRSPSIFGFFVSDEVSFVAAWIVSLILIIFTLFMKLLKVDYIVFWALLKMKYVIWLCDPVFTIIILLSSCSLIGQIWSFRWTNLASPFGRVKCLVDRSLLEQRIEFLFNFFVYGFIRVFTQQFWFIQALVLWWRTSFLSNNFCISWFHQLRLKSVVVNYFIFWLYKAKFFKTWFYVRFI